MNIVKVWNEQGIYFGTMCEESAKCYVYCWGGHYE